MQLTHSDQRDENSQQRLAMNIGILKMKTQIFKLISLSLIALITSFSSAAATAKDTQNDFLVVSAGAYHFENFDERNAFTPGLGWEYSPSGKIGWHAGTLSDSFGYQAMYGGINYATKPTLYGKVRFLLGASVVHKQFKKNGEAETKVLPLPAMEVKLTKRSVVNVSGSPQVDYGNHRNNAVLFFQFKLNIR